MNFYDNMNQSVFGENQDGQLDENTTVYQPDDPDTGQGEYQEGAVPPGDDVPDMDNSEIKEGDNDGSDQSDKPKRKRKKKEDKPTTEDQDAGDDEVQGGQGEFEDPDGPFSSTEEPGAGEEYQDNASDGGAAPGESDAALPEDAGSGLLDHPEDTMDGLPIEWPTTDEQPEGFTPEDGTPLELPNFEEEGNVGASATEDNSSPDERPARPARRRQSASRRPAVLDASGNVIVQRGDSGQHELSVLTAAKNARRILTATVDGIETDGEALPRVIFYQGTVKVMIPFSHMGFDLDPEQVSQREARLLIDSMLGARIDYMVRGVDTESRVAAASRRDAMLLRQRSILNARGTSSDFRINEGMRVTARVIHVARQVVRVEVFGFECYVRIDSISNVWVNDIREVIQVGEERQVEIVQLRRDDAGRCIFLRVSMKAAEDAPQLELRDGNTYTGAISNFSDTAYYVRVNGIPVEVRCPIKSNHTMEMMNQGDYVKFYIRGIYDGVPTGAILKIIKKKLQPSF